MRLKMNKILIFFYISLSISIAQRPITSDDIVNFHETAIKRKIISTPSYDQVNKPIYQDSIYRWKKYEKNITKIYSVLNPWIKKFNY